MNAILLDTERVLRPSSKVQENVDENEYELEDAVQRVMQLSRARVKPLKNSSRIRIPAAAVTSSLGFGSLGNKHATAVAEKKLQNSTSVSAKKPTGKQQNEGVTELLAGGKPDLGEFVYLEEADVRPYLKSARGLHRKSRSVTLTWKLSLALVVLSAVLGAYMAVKVSRGTRSLVKKMKEKFSTYEMGSARSKGADSEESAAFQADANDTLDAILLDFLPLFLAFWSPLLGFMLKVVLVAVRLAEQDPQRKLQGKHLSMHHLE